MGRWQGHRRVGLRTVAQPIPEVARTLSTSAASIALSRGLTKHGWPLVGPAAVYAFMQAMGLTHDL